MDNADRAEAECIRRYEILDRLGREIEEAARRADARVRLELALGHGVRRDAEDRWEHREAA